MGARWFEVGDGTLFASGQVAGLPVGTQTVDFLTLPGFLKPAARGVALSGGQTGLVQASYTPLARLALDRGSGLSLSGPSGATYRIEFRFDLGGSADWSNLTTRLLSNAPCPIPGTQPTNRGNQFFRGVLQP